MKLNPLILTVRFSSTRLPGKCMLPFSAHLDHEESVLTHVINRAKLNSRQLIVCTGIDRSNIPIIEACKKLGIDYFQGSDDNKIKRWNDCFSEYELAWAHFVDVDDLFFCNSELELSIENFRRTNKVSLSTAKSKSGNASVGITMGAENLLKMYEEVGSYRKFEMVDDLLKLLFAKNSVEIQSLDPIPSGTRLTLDYFEDYIALSLIKLGLSTKATRLEVYKFILENPWVMEINISRNAEWKVRQAAILESQGKLIEQ